MTDIEGSTRLFREQGDAYVGLLQSHERLLGEAFARHHGVVFESEGDALLAAFTDAAEALVGCLEGMRALADHQWPSGGEIRVRMGVHTDHAVPVGSRYVALALHQAARICAGAHGGQILMSAATADAASGRLPEEVSLMPLGSFQLRGFAAPVRLLQLRHPRLGEEFPPLRALGIVAHNLPFFRTAFLGRARDRSGVARLLANTGVVSIVGLGGVGKTRLAIQVAFDVMEEFSDGAWLVELGPVTDSAAVPRTVASALEVAEAPGREIEDLLVEWLAPKKILLLLDNCEHLLDAVAGFTERAVRHCPQLVVLATSREPLEIEGEAVWRLAPLPVVDPSGVGLEELAEVESVRLFAERAALVDPGFRLTGENAADVARLAAQLNGIPLAIELAAAALSDRSLAGVIEGLGDRFSLLTHGRRTAPERHQTLRAALEWSLDLLEAATRRFFARLAVFAGGASTEAAGEVCAADATEDAGRMLRRLTRSSLIVLDPDAGDRWAMLESIRELAALELAGLGETDLMSGRHRDWYARRLEQAGDDIGRRGRSDVMKELVADHDNIRRAVETAVAARDAVSALRICVAAAPFWTSHGDWTEGCERLAAALALGGADDRLRGQAAVSLGSLLQLRGNLAGAQASFIQGRQLAEAAEDDVSVARALSGIGYVAFRNSRLAEAEALWNQALQRAERGGDERTTAGILRSLAIAAGAGGEQTRAGELLDRAIALADRAEDDQLLRLLLGSAAEMHLWLGHYPMAEDSYAEALSLATRIGDLSARPLLLAELGWVALLRGDPPTARRLSVEAAELAEVIGNSRVLAHSLRLRGEALARIGELGEASSVLDQALRVAEDLGAPAELAGVRCSQACAALDELRADDARRLAGQALSLGGLRHTMRRASPAWVLGWVAADAGELDEAEGHFRSDLDEAGRAQIPRHQANSLAGLAAVAAARGDTAGAVRLERRALELRREIGDRLGVVESLVAVAAVAASGEPTDAIRLIEAATALRASTGAIATPREADRARGAMEAVARTQAAHLLSTGVGAEMDEDAAVATAERLLTVMEETRPLSGRPHSGI